MNLYLHELETKCVGLFSGYFQPAWAGGDAPIVDRMS